MTITTQKDLAKLIKLCRSTGIESIEVDNLKIKLGKLEPKLGKQELSLPDLSVPKYTPEDVLFFSSTPLDGEF